MSGNATRIRAAVAVGAVSAVGALTYVRLYFGVDFTDESFYAAVPYRFVSGAQPLVDETSVVPQATGVLLYPFFAVWESIVGRDGIVLYARHLHLFFSIAVSVALFVALRGILQDRAHGAALASAAVAFVPFGIHGLSYNTVAAGLFACGSFLGLAWLYGGSRRILAISGAASGLSIFVYPTFALPVACLYVAIYFLSRPRTLRRLVPALVSAAAGALAALAFFLHRGFGTLHEAVERHTAFAGQGGLAGLDEVVTFVYSSFTHKLLALALFVAAAGLRVARPEAAFVPLLLLPFAALPAELGTSASANMFVANVGLLAPGVFLFVRDSPVARRLLAAVWLPAAVAGLTTALSSTNGGINVAIGSFPAAIVTGALLGLAVRQTWGARVSPLDITPAIAIAATCVALQYLSVYRDAGMRHLPALVTDGAFAGLHTTHEKRDFLNALDRDLEAASGPRCRIFFYDTFPAGYLLGHGTPATNATWFVDVEDGQEVAYQRELLAYYRDRGLPDVVVRIDRMPLTDTSAIEQVYSPGEPLERTFGGARYELVHEGSGYRISRKRSTTCR